MPLVTNGPGALTLGADDRVRAIAAVKARLRIVSVDEDDLVAAFAEAALGIAEQLTGQALIARTMTQRIVGIGGWQRLAARPVRAIDAVADGAGVALPVGSYAVDIDGNGLGWARIDGGQVARASFTAGLAEDWDALPAAIRDGAAMLAAHLFDDRSGAAPVPAAVGALWRPFRVMRLQAAVRA